jgi:3-phosphoshikimate 1-carboxyvinyltransferase
MDVTVHPGGLSGRVRAPSSKSYTHRALLAAGLGDGERIHGPLRSADTEATARAVSSYGGAVTWPDEEASATVAGVSGDLEIPTDVIDCANSGTTMRLATAVAGLVDGTTVLTGDASLRKRPQGPLLEAIEQLGGAAESTRGTGEPPVVVRGPIHGGRVEIPGDVSSQFVTALLMAGALTDEGVSVELTTPLKSAPYVDITLEVLSAFGVSATTTDQGYRVAGEQEYDAGGEYAVPGDFSSISYLLAAGAIAAPAGLTIAGAVPSAQGDSAIVDVVESMGGSVDWHREAGELSVSAEPLVGVSIGVGDTPDLLPTIAALGAVADGTTRITDCEHVRYKETDRVTVMAEELERMGAVVEEHPSELVVHGGESDLQGTTVAGHGDHRIIMALTVAALGATGPTKITGAEDVSVSFPSFFETLSSLGATVDTQA